MDWLEQYLGSAVRYIQNHADNDSALYFDDLPENFIVPSIYFPVPRTSGRKVTFDTFLMNLYVDAWFMASTDWLAYAAASNVRDCIMLDSCKIDVIEKDGTLSGKAFRVTDPETYPVDTGIVRLSFTIKHYFSKQEDPPQKAENFYLSGFVKPDTLYKAWYSATQEQRKDEEVQKECLKKALKSL